MKVKVEKNPHGAKSEVELNVTIPAKDFAMYWEKGLKAVQEVVEIDGFRKGKAPENMIISKYGEMAILEEMANICVNETYVKAVTDNKLKVLGHPHFHLTKLAKGEDFEYQAHVAVYPEIDLPNYKKIAKEASKDKKEVEVKDEDVNNVLKDLQKMRVKDKKFEDITEADLPPLDDEFAKTFGEEFKTIDDIKAKVAENLKLEKEQQAKEASRAKILEALVAETKFDLPEILVQSEVDRMLAQLKMDVEKFGGKFSDYLTHIKKTEEDLRAEYAEPAEKRAKSQMIVIEISEKEKIKPTAEEIDAEVIRIMAAVQNADEDRAKGYAEQVLTNEKVLQFLEK
jgi:FKBP-type peptidyl-prolyl cis-trans isomerase (trigger factor)